MTALADLLAACLQVQSDRNAAKSTKAMAAALGKWAPTVLPPAPAPAPTPTPTPTPEPVYLFQDEFTGAAGSPPDPAKWWATPWCSTSADDAEGCYNARNAFQDGTGNLVLRVSAGTMGRPYDMARIQTFREGGWPPPATLWTHGAPIRVEARIRFAPGPGVWGGFWPMGTNATTPLEIDVQEFRGFVPTTIAMHTHGPLEGSTSKDAGVDLSAAFHVYGCDYYGDHVDYRFDGAVIATLPAVPQSLGIRLSNAVGPPGTWGGQGGPPPAADIPADMLVDYVRVTAL